MLDDGLLGTWLDKIKAKKELCKAYKMYQEKKKPYLNLNTIHIYEEFQNIQYAIAYVLCEHFGLKHKNEFSVSANSIEWDICYDYKIHYDECKEAYEKLTK